MNFKMSMLAGLAYFAGTVSSLAQSDFPPPVRQDTAKTDFEALGDYIGQWRSEEKQARDKNERPFRFEYELSYFDADRTIAHMVIRQVFADGEERLLWIGFKGWDSVERQTYYHGYSPLGRVARGKFIEDGDHFITFYAGSDVDGQVVEVRDVFTPVENDQYENVTYLRPAGDDAWRIVARDVWRRVE